MKDFHKIYCHRILQQLTSNAIELLFARLPWTTSSEVFLQPEVKRIFCVHQGQSTTTGFFGDECTAFIVKTSRSVSPRKRKPEPSEAVKTEARARSLISRKGRHNSLLSSRNSNFYEVPYGTASSGSASNTNPLDLDSTPEEQYGKLSSRLGKAEENFKDSWPQSRTPL